MTHAMATGGLPFVSVSPRIIPAVESPSLMTALDPGRAFEIKFLLDESRAQAVEAWARNRLERDPHGEPALGGAYRTTSLYTDTPAHDVYFRSAMFRRRKFRVRRYGPASWAFLERKTKSGDRVSKRRTSVPIEELSTLAQPMSTTTWPGHWFHQRLLLRSLQPACQIAYVRTAYVGSCSESPLRLTLDRDIHGFSRHEWSFDNTSTGRMLLPDRVIMELKFRNALPIPFKELIQNLQISPQAVSKYRLFCESTGVVNPLPRMAHA